MIRWQVRIVFLLTTSLLIFPAHLTAQTPIPLTPDLAASAHSDVTLPKIFGDNMVLQRDIADPVWGHAAGAEKITVTFGDQTKTAQADAAGQWQVRLDPMSASDTPRDLTVTGSSTVTFHNVLVGEVWLCSGQSNMEYPMVRAKWAPPPRTGPDQIPSDLAAANDPSLRLFLVEKKLDIHDVVTTSGWQACQTKALSPFSAVAYYFGKELREQLKIPVGLIDSSWGGQKIQRFTTPAAYIADPFFQLPSADYSSTYDGEKIGDIYHFMIQPLVPFAIRGAIWYQGESNVTETTAQYAHQMHGLITGWRSAWSEGDFPFYYVQLAPFHYVKAPKKTATAHHPAARPATPTSLPDIWQAQTESLTIPNTGMAATIDITDNRDNIHPPDKWDLGHRLSLLALAKNYGRKDLVYSGPLYKNLEIQGAKAIVHFDFVGSGLVSRDGKPLTSFTIAGSDGKFVPADAEISGDTVIVTSPQVAAPAAVRFAWIQDADPNLSNKDGLPAFPFQTDAPPPSN